MAEEVKTKKPAAKKAAEKPAAEANADKPVKEVKPARKKAEKAEKPAAEAKAAKPARKKAEKTEKPAAAKIKVTLVKSTISSIPAHKKTVAALGLKKVNSFKIHEENPCILGMIDKVKHLVKVEKV